MLYKLFVEPKFQKLTTMVELAVALGHLTVALSGHINQVFFTTNKPIHFNPFANHWPYLEGALAAFTCVQKFKT